MYIPKEIVREVAGAFIAPVIDCFFPRESSMDEGELTSSELRALNYATQESLKLDQNLKQLKEISNQLHLDMIHDEEIRKKAEKFQNGTIYYD